MSWPGSTSIENPLPTVPMGNTVVPARATWTHTGAAGEPDATVRFELRDGRPECVEVVIRARPDGREVRTTDLASIHLDGLVSAVIGHFGLRQDDDGGWRLVDGEAYSGKPPGGSERVQAVREVDRARSVRVTRAELEEVARIYREHRDGHPIQAVKALRGYSSERTAARRVKAAEHAGLLPKTTKGKRRDV